MVQKPIPTSPFNQKMPDTAQNTPRLPLLWRVTLVWIASTLIWLLIGEIAHARFGWDYSRSAHHLRAFLATALTIPLIVGARYFLDRRPWASLGLGSLRSGWRPLLIGMVCWLVPAAIGTMICLLLGWTTMTPNAPLDDIFLTAISLLVLVFIYEALPEELIFRGYFFRNLANAMPLWLAILLQAILFTLWGLANGGENSLERSLLFFSFAIVVGIFRAKTGSVWGAIGFHLAFQTVAQLFGTVGNQFTMSNPQALMVFAFSILPFAASITLLNLFYKNRPNWRESLGDTP
jgi:membrane protease YdiL (CAAX protease family)